MKPKTVNEAGRKGGQSRSAAKIAAGRRNKHS
jgi:general stress protein YciG